MENEKDLKTKLVEKEKELQKKCEEIKNQSTVPSIETDAASLSKAMSEVNLKYVELTRLKQQNKNLEEIALKKEQEKKEIEEKMLRSNKLEYQVNKAGGWPNGLARGQTYDLG